jgi:membrane protease subunit (stomatin/prohibitin family)
MPLRRTRRRSLIVGAAIGSSRARKSAAAQVPAQPTATPTTDDSIAQLKQLSELKDQGILTQAEFDAKKTQILGL